ncbi:MAG: DHH family phosphoesterase, partial [Acidobacteriota bacterium]
MDDAVARLLRARDAGETVVLVGDYDVDGVTGTALLVAVLGACGLRVRPILPHRLRDGYGFQPVHVERARAFEAGLIVTVDCGTSSHAAIAAARQAEIDVHDQAGFEGARALDVHRLEAVAVAQAMRQD